MTTGWPLFFIIYVLPFVIFAAGFVCGRFM